jgi:hypothetical protein
MKGCVTVAAVAPWNLIACCAYRLGENELGFLAGQSSSKKAGRSGRTGLAAAGAGAAEQADPVWFLDAAATADKYLLIGMSTPFMSLLPQLALLGCQTIPVGASVDARCED